MVEGGILVDGSSRIGSVPAFDQRGVEEYLERLGLEPFVQDPIHDEFGEVNDLLTFGSEFRTDQIHSRNIVDIDHLLQARGGEVVQGDAVLDTVVGHTQPFQLPFMFDKPFDALGSERDFYRELDDRTLHLGSYPSKLTYSA